MDEKGQVPPPAYDSTYGVSNPAYDTVYSPQMINTGGPVQQTSPYGYAQPAYGNTVVTQQPIPVYNQVAVVPDNMAMAIFAIFCCWPLGIAAIMKASDSRTALARNDIPSAIANANDARRYSWMGIGVKCQALLPHQRSNMRTTYTEVRQKLLTHSLCSLHTNHGVNVSITHVQKIR
ncbi:hypothetical protein Btru_058646 [Bulinus truncatus]|nr:hypothetical protein Btru_058646 [Bulinus truncatus]